MIEKTENGYVVNLSSGTISLMDDKPYLEYFERRGSAIEFMAKVDVWGEDLTKISDFANAVSTNVSKILSGERLI